MIHSARASPALRALVEADPAIAALSLWCAHRDRDQPLAAMTEGEVIHYGPPFDALPPHEATGVAAHHILHAALRHSARMGAMALRMGEGFDRALWSIAADAIVNEALLEAGHALPRPALRLTGLLAAALGQVSGPREALAEWDADRLYLRLRAEGAEGRAKAHAAARGHAEDLAPAETEAAPEASAADWRAHVTRAMEAGRIAGRGIGMVARGMADLPQARTPWEVILRGLVARALLPLPHETHRRPARAWLAMEAEARAAGGPAPAFQPGLARAAPAPRLVLALDTSSSIDDTRLRLFLGEIIGIARRVAAEALLLPFDDTPMPPVRLDLAAGSAQMAGLKLRRGGGTAFAPALAAAAALRPAMIVVLTDLEGDPGPDPRIPVLWAVPDAAGIDLPPFGRVLSLAH